jgi:hypothetical protein
MRLGGVGRMDRGLREGSGQIGDLVEMSGRRWQSGCEMG